MLNQETRQQEQTSTEKKKPEGTTLLTKEEEKTEGADKGEKKEGGDKKDAKTGAPEKYEDFKAPEGFEIDKAAIEKFSPLFKEMGLTQENAQKLVDTYAQINKDVAEAPFKAWNEMNEKWQKEVKEAPDLGPKWDSEIKPAIGRAMATLPAEVRAEFSKAMDITGAGNHPAFIRAFYGLAKQLNEGGHVSGRGPSEHGQTKTGQTERPSVAGAIWSTLPKS